MSEAKDAEQNGSSVLPAILVTVIAVSGILIVLRLMDIL